MQNSELKEELCEKIRVITEEFGQECLNNAVIIGPHDEKHVSDIPYIYAPTLGWHIMGGVEHKVARTFEDLDLLKGSYIE